MYKFLIICFSIFILILVKTAVAGKLMEPVAGEPKAEKFNLVATNGNSISLEDFQGKFVLLNFWATWCAPCRKEMPSMSNLHNQFKGRGLEVVGVHVGPSLAGVKKFLEAVPVDFTVLIDKNMSLASWGVRGLPTTFLINPGGKIIYKATGERIWDSPEMMEFLDGLISSYGHMTENMSPVRLKLESLIAYFKESIGRGNDDRAEHSLPN